MPGVGKSLPAGNCRQLRLPTAHLSFVDYSGPIPHFNSFLANLSLLVAKHAHGHAIHCFFSQADGLFTHNGLKTSRMEPPHGYYSSRCQEDCAAPTAASSSRWAARRHAPTVRAEYEVYIYIYVCFLYYIYIGSTPSVAPLSPDQVSQG